MMMMMLLVIIRNNNKSDVVVDDYDDNHNDELLTRNMMWKILSHIVCENEFNHFPEDIVLFDIFEQFIWSSLCKLQ